jgi:putative acetyltransferase
MNPPPESRDPVALEISAEPLVGPVAQSLIATLNAELSALYPEPGATHFSLDPAQVAPGTGAFLVVRRDGQPIGCGALRRLTDDSVVAELGTNVGELKRMFVARDGRGQGIGRALLAELETAARRLGMSRIVLETGIRQHEALALYRRAGYADIPAYGEYSLSPGTSVCLGKML